MNKNRAKNSTKEMQYVELQYEGERKAQDIRDDIMKYLRQLRRATGNKNIGYVYQIDNTKLRPRVICKISGVRYQIIRALWNHGCCIRHC